MDILRGRVPLTGSKSESNRALIIQALSQGKVHIDNLSEAADTVALQAALQVGEPAREQVIDIGPAGTAMRFLTAYLSLKTGTFLLTGSARMKERPIGVLVDALRHLGAHIEYAAQEGYPPLRIRGPLQQSDVRTRVAGNISSQYVSALLLIAPKLPQGLHLEIEGELTSRPYLMMTLKMLEEAGITHRWEGSEIRIQPQDFHSCTLTIEPDWSAASYWYSLAALSPKADLFLPALKPDSLQGDQAIKDIMNAFGIHSNFEAGGLRIRKEAAPSSLAPIHLDFTACPDLAQTVIVCCAALKRPASFTGLHTLRIKETDRIAALQNELAKFGVRLEEQQSGTFHLDCQDWQVPAALKIRTYEDHRMAMAFAPLALIFDHVEIEDPAVVEKSYPAFWTHLKQFGITFDHSK